MLMLVDQPFETGRYVLREIGWPANSFHLFVSLFCFLLPKSMKSFEAGGGPVLLMGLWDWTPTHELLSFTILTTEPGPRFGRIHNRVPAIAPSADTVEAFFAGDVGQFVELASRSNDDVLTVDPPEPAAAA